MYKRSHCQLLKKRIEEPRKFIQVLAGPRQVGKTTILRQVCADISIPFSVFGLDDVPATQGSYISDCWNTVRNLMKINKEEEHLLIFDEIQKIDNWSETVKKEWDADTWNNLSIKVIISGSSRLLIQNGLTESLMGRFELIRVPHWSFSEMHEAFGLDVDKFIFFGGYPGATGFIDDEPRWRNYVRDTMIEPTIAKDVLNNHVITKPSLMRRLFELGSSYSSQILSLNKMLGELDDAGNTTTLAGYLNLLSECGMLAGISKYAGSVIRKKNSIPKFQVYNNALRNVYCEFDFRKAKLNPKEWGRIFESAIGAHLINYVEPGGLKLYYWRENNDEVDFILEKFHTTVAIEVKSAADTHNTGLQIFKNKFNPKSAFFVGSSGIPVEDFLSADPNDLF